MRLYTPLIFALLPTTFLACGGDDDPEVDATGPTYDAAKPMYDAATPTFDAATPTFDAATPTFDAATPMFDAAVADATPSLDAVAADATPSLDAVAADAAPTLDAAVADAAPTLDAAVADAAPTLDAAVADAAPTSGSHLVLSEVTLTPTENEFIEIYNPTASTIDLTNYYLADDDDYAHLPGATGAGPAPVISAADFIVQFPASATIAPGATVVVALSAPDFVAAFTTVTPDYSIKDPAASGVTQMLQTSVGATAGLTNDGEMIALFYWDGVTDLVQDVDLIEVGTASGGNVLSNKSSDAVDGPDADTTATSYATDLATMPTMSSKPGNSFSAKRVALETSNETQAGTGNGITGDDETSENIATTWENGGAIPFSAPTPGSPDIVAGP